MARPVLALLALPLALPASATAAPKRGQDIRKVEAITTSAGALVRVTLRAPLDGRVSVRFRQGAGRGSPAAPPSPTGAARSSSCSPATPATSRACSSAPAATGRR